MLVVHEREFELRPHAVSRGNKDRLRHIAYIGAEKSTEATDVGENALGVRLRHDRLDLGYKTVAGFDVDAGFRIGFRPFCRHKHSLLVPHNSKTCPKAQYARAFGGNIFCFFAERQEMLIVKKDTLMSCAAGFSAGGTSHENAG